MAVIYHAGMLGKLEAAGASGASDAWLPGWASHSPPICTFKGCREACVEQVT